MNADLFISSPQYQQWCMAHLNASRKEDMLIQNLVQSSAFKNWLQQNPNGTVDQYLQALHAYRQTPEYQLQELNSQIYYLNEEIEELNDEVSELKEEIEYKDGKIQGDNRDIMIKPINAELSVEKTVYAPEFGKIEFIDCLVFSWKHDEDQHGYRIQIIEGD